MFKVGVFLYEDFMIEKVLFLYPLFDFDVTKDILKHRTLKILLLDVQKVALIIYIFLKVHFAFSWRKDIA